MKQPNAILREFFESSELTFHKDYIHGSAKKVIKAMEKYAQQFKHPKCPKCGQSDEVSDPEYWCERCCLPFEIRNDNKKYNL